MCLLTVTEIGSDQTPQIIRCAGQIKFSGGFALCGSEIEKHTSTQPLDRSVLNSVQLYFCQTDAVRDIEITQQTSQNKCVSLFLTDTHTQRSREEREELVFVTYISCETWT